MARVRTIDELSIVDAVAHLLMSPEFEGDRFAIATAVWNGDEVPELGAGQSLDVEKLRTAIDSLQKWMNKTKLPSDHRMCLVLWLRAFAKARVAVSEDALRWVEHVRLARERQQPRLYQVFDSETKRWGGPPVDVKGLEPNFGWTFAEMVLAPMTPLRYRQKWRAVAMTPVVSKQAIRRKAGATGRRAGAKRKPMTVKNYQVMYGTGVVDALKKACASDLRGNVSGILTKGSPSGRAFSAECSSDMVIDHLRTAHASLLGGYERSTLQHALPVWVECPRGRPKRKPKLSPRTTVSKATSTPLSKGKRKRRF